MLNLKSPKVYRRGFWGSPLFRFSSYVFFILSNCPGCLARGIPMIKSLNQQLSGNVTHRQIDAAIFSLGYNFIQFLNIFLGQACLFEFKSNNG